MQMGKEKETKLKLGTMGLLIAGPTGPLPKERERGRGTPKNYWERG